MATKKKVSRGLKVGGGLIVLGVVAGTFLAKLLPEFEGGDGVLPGAKSQAKVESQTEEVPDREAEKEITLGSDRVLRIAIQNRSYWLDSDANRNELSLEQVVRLAKEAPGDENGIRVHIRRDETARAKAEEDLQQALLDAGLPPTAVVGLGQARP